MSDAVSITETTKKMYLVVIFGTIWKLYTYLVVIFMENQAQWEKTSNTRIKNKVGNDNLGIQFDMCE